MWPEDLRGTFYFTTVWMQGVVSILALILLPDLDQGFFVLYFITWFVLIVASALTAGFGIAEFLQARWDEKRLRRGIERELLENRNG